MKVYIAADHAGFALKEVLKGRLMEAGYEIEDCGAATLDETDDYPDFVSVCAHKVAADQGAKGVVIGASGQGEAMAANRVPGARAAVYYGDAARSQTDAAGTSLSLIQSVRAHNDANILSLGARFITKEEALAATLLFLSTPFSKEERHLRRVEKLA